MGISFRNIREFSNIKTSPNVSNNKFQYDPITDTGYYGVVDASELFTGQEISTALGLTAGTLHNDDTQWLHFYVGSNAACNREPNKVPYEIYIAKQSVRYSIRWNQINATGAVAGKVVTDKKGNEYICRIPTGAEANPHPRNETGLDITRGGLCEWDALMYRVHDEVPIGQVGNNWESFNTTETNIGAGNGAYTWCQERHPHIWNSAATQVVRGVSALTRFSWTSSNTTADLSGYGFRPVLIKRLS